jgi:hypothetical protein
MTEIVKYKAGLHLNPLIKKVIAEMKGKVLHVDSARTVMHGKSYRYFDSFEEAKVCLLAEAEARVVAA